MGDWSTGFAAGIAVGLVIGLFAVKKGKKWSELTEKEKMVTITLTILGVVLFAAGIAAFFLLNNRS